MYFPNNIVGLKSFESYNTLTKKNLN